MQEILFHAHSGLRYLVLLAGVVAFLFAVVGMAAGRPYGRGMRIAGLSFAGLLHLQVLLGFFLLVSGRFPAMAVAMHILFMLFAAVVAQLPSSVMRRRPREERTHAPHAVSTVVALLLIAMGIASLGRPILGF